MTAPDDPLFAVSVVLSIILLVILCVVGVVCMQRPAGNSCRKLTPQHIEFVTRNKSLHEKILVVANGDRIFPTVVSDANGTDELGDLLIWTPPAKTSKLYLSVDNKAGEFTGSKFTIVPRNKSFVDNMRITIPERNELIKLDLVMLVCGQAKLDIPGRA